MTETGKRRVGDLERDRRILWEMELSSILFRVATVQICSTVKLHQTEHVNYTSIKIWFKWEPIMIFKKKKRKRNALFFLILT